MKKILTAIAISILLFTIVGCGEDKQKEAINQPQLIDIVSVKPVITVSKTEDVKEVVEIEVRNNSINNLSDILLSSGDIGEIVTINTLSGNEVKKIRSELPVNYSIDDLELEVKEYSKV